MIAVSRLQIIVATLTSRVFSQMLYVMEKYIIAVPFPLLEANDKYKDHFDGQLNNNGETHTKNIFAPGRRKINHYNVFGQCNCHQVT